MRVHYEEYGEGTPLVLLHGFTESSQTYQPYIGEFSRHFWVIVPDQRLSPGWRVDVDPVSVL